MATLKAVHASQHAAMAALASLCKLCADFTRAFETEVINFEVPGFWESDPGANTGLYKHHRRYADLESVASTCALCRTFWGAVLANGTNRASERARCLYLDAKVPSYRYLTIGLVRGFGEISASGHMTRGIAYGTFADEGGIPNESLWFSLSAKNESPPYIDRSAIGLDWDVEYFRVYLEKCMLEHTECSGTIGNNLPTRVLDVDGMSESGSLKLMNSTGRSGRYVALSYCWGLSTPFCTTKATLHERLSDIAFDALPRIYQDAVKVTRGLSLRYLWIDALCIVQNDTEDWLRESARMGTVYEGATLVINAPTAASADQAMLPARAKAATCIVPVAWTADQPQSTATVTLTDFRRRQELIEGPDCSLNTRAWVFQEYMLARRTLTFGSFNTYLSCRRWTIFEDAHEPVPTEFTRSSVPSPETEPTLRSGILSGLAAGGDAHRLWYLFLVHYTNRYLTYENDKVPALMGLAQRVAEHLSGDRFVAGLWYNDMINGLAWMRFDQYRESYHMTHSLHPRTAKVPTWSWASCDRHIRHVDVYGMPEISHDLIDNIVLSSDDHESTGHVRQSFMPLRLRGSIIPCLEERIWTYESDDVYKPVIVRYHSKHSASGPNYFVVLPEPYACEAHWVHDTEEEQQPRSEDELGILSILPLSLAVKPPLTYSGAPTVSPDAYPCLRVLVVKPSRAHAGTLERVGFAACHLTFPRRRWATPEEFVDWMLQPSQRTVIDLV
nr:hypothetical protein B0A51_00010 [Rachicladosporium sp. CCFEE 5018]